MTVQDEFRKPLAEQIGRTIRGWRTEENMTQADVANELKISPQQFQKYETGASRIELSRLFEICAVFGKQPSDILGSLNNPEPKPEAGRYIDAATAQTPNSEVQAAGQADMSFQVSELVASFLAIRTWDDKQIALFLVQSLSQR